MSGWRPASRTQAAEAIHGAAEADRAKNPARYELGEAAADGVIARAAGDRDAGELGVPAEWRAGLIRYLQSAQDDGRLNALGARNVLSSAVGKLRARASMARYLRTHPSTERKPLAPPIIIIGGWRTGTTFLFRLLGSDRRLRAPLPAELTAPWKTGADRTQPECDAVIEASAAAHETLHVLNPMMAAVHDSGARLAEECVLAMGVGFRNWGFTSTTRLDSYAHWLAGEDLSVEYAHHRRVLQMLDRQDGRRWVLKAPAHTAELAQVARAYPGACVVHLHRDIVETVASGASLFATFRSSYSDEVDAQDVGRFQAEQTELWLKRALAFRETAEARAVTLADVRYVDLIKDTAGALRSIYAAVQMEPPADIEGMIAHYNAAHPRGAKGAHAYTPADFGIDASALRERFAFYDLA